MIGKIMLPLLFDTLRTQRLLRFGITGVLTAILYFLALITAVEFANLPPVWGAIIAFWIPLPVNYFLHRNWSFGSDVTHAQGVPRFLFTVLTGFGLNALVMYLGAGVSQMHYLLVQVFAAGAVITWNFIIFSIFVFFPRSKSSAGEYGLKGSGGNGK